ncbi:hypothetical protein ULF88_05475 [Halopseudomonas pachastrellae]|nr:hypothetical protein [Halopseudomonas pachastrellae]
MTEPHSFDVEVALTLDGKDYQWRWESHEGRTTIAPEIAQRAGIATTEAGPGTIERKLTTYGSLTLAPQQTARVRPLPRHGHPSDGEPGGPGQPRRCPGRGGIQREPAKLRGAGAH